MSTRDTLRNRKGKPPSSGGSTSQETKDNDASGKAKGRKGKPSCCSCQGCVKVTGGFLVFYTLLVFILMSGPPHGPLKNPHSVDDGPILLHQRQTTSAIIDAPVEEVWKIQSPWADMTKWYKAFEKLTVTKGSGEVGSERECLLVGGKGKIIRERLVKWSPETFEYSYSMLPYSPQQQQENPLPVNLVDHRADVSLHPITSGKHAGKTLVLWEINYNVADGQEDLARKVTIGIFKPLFEQLNAYMKAHSGSAKQESSVVVGDSVRRGQVLSTNEPMEYVWQALSSREPQAASPGWTVRPFPPVPPQAVAGYETEVPGRQAYVWRLDDWECDETVDRYFDFKKLVGVVRDGKDLDGKVSYRRLIPVGLDADVSTTLLMVSSEHKDTAGDARVSRIFPHIVNSLEVEVATRVKNGANNPCCGMPCSEHGVCVPLSKHRFTCDCGHSGYTGDRCDRPSWSLLFSTPLSVAVDAWTDLLLTSGCSMPAPLNQICIPSFDREQHLRNSAFLLPIIKLVNLFGSKKALRSAVELKTLVVPMAPPPYSVKHGYKAWDGMMNNTYYGRLLAPVPEECPTPAGNIGKRQFWSAERVVNTFLKRRKFVPSSVKISALLPIWAQHFTHQFFKTASGQGHQGLTSHLDHYVDMNHVYGHNEAVQHLLREHKGGRMLMKKGANGEWMPPTLSDIKGGVLPSDVPETTFKYLGARPEERFALGHPFFSIFPGLTAISTIWLREHNRVAGLLQKEHPDWSDERLFQTTRLIIILECMHVVVSDYVGDNLAAGNLKIEFFADAVMGAGLQHQNRIAIEFNHLYHWHPLLPDSYTIGNESYTERELLFRNHILLKHGVGQVLDAMSRQIAGEANGANFGYSASNVAIRVLEYGRSLRLPSLNAYRQSAGQRPYTSFEEMHDDPKVVAKLKECYGHVDAVEMFLGMMVEKRREGGLFGPTITARGVPSTFQGVFGHPLLSESNFRPSTFGGGVGWEIVNSPLTLEKLIQRNSPPMPDGKPPRGKMNVRDLPPAEVTWQQYPKSDVHIVTSGLIHAPIDQVFPVQSSFAHMNKWYKTFSKINMMTPGDSERVGARRECVIAGKKGKFIREELLALNPKEYTYSYHLLPYDNPSENPLPLFTEDHRADVSLHPVSVDGKAATLVVWKIFYRVPKSQVKLSKLLTHMTFADLFKQLEAYFQGNTKPASAALNQGRVLRSGQGALSARQGRLFTEPADDVWTNLAPADGELSPLFSVYRDTFPDGSRSPRTGTRRMYHFETAGRDGFTWEIVEAVDYQSEETDKAHTLRASFDTSNIGNKGLSNAAHSGSRFVLPVVFNGGKYKSAVVFHDDVKFAGKDNGVGQKFVSYFFDKVTDFLHASVTEEPDTAFGKLVKRTFTHQFAIDPAYYWSAFDDYMEVQKVFSGHDDMELDPNKPANGVGATITFTQPGFDMPTVEELTIKQDKPDPCRVWQIILPVANPFFSKYTATVDVCDSESYVDGVPKMTHATLNLAVVFVSKSEKMRAFSIKTAAYYATIRLQQIAYYLLHRDGAKIPFEPFVLNYPVQGFWDEVNTWSRSTWVQFSQSVVTNLEGTERYVNWGKGRYLLESVPYTDEAKKELTYFPQRPLGMKCILYAGTIKMSDLGDGRTRVQYTSQFVPRKDQDVESVRANIKKLFLPRFDYLQATFKARA